MTPAFVVAAPSERELGAGAYLAGLAELALIAAALAWAAYRVRRLLLPGWSGAPARLVEVVFALCGLMWLSELLGTFSAYEEWTLIGGSVVVAALAEALWRRSAPAVIPAPRQVEAVSRLAKVAALGACAALAAAWMIPTLGTLAAGMDRADSLWYHMPLSARFAQTGDLGQIYFFDPIFLASFYPANSEVVHAAPLLTFGRDIASPLINLGWLSLSLLAAWCIGRPYGVAPHALVGASVALGSQMLVEFQAGEALNDITGVAFVLAAVAILVNAHASERRGPAIGAAGLSAGLAAGTKLSFLAPVGALFLGAVLIAPRLQRRRTALLFALPALAAGGYWYLRNLLAVGNPIPYIHSIGPIDLPSPARDFELRPGFAISHYWNDFDVWDDWFAPGFDDALGLLWPVTLLGMLAVGALALWRGREPVLRALGGIVLFTAIAYVFTPLTAAGEEGEPIAFVWNVRYLAPAVAVGLALVPCLPDLRASPRRRLLTLGALAALLAVTVASLVQWDQGHTKGAIAAGAGVLLAGGFLLFALPFTRARPALRARGGAAVAAIAVVAAVAGGYRVQDHYIEHRYENTGSAQHLAEALRWSRDIRDARIAVGGIRGVFTQYPFYGTDLSNHVQWLGRRTDHDGYERIPDCETWRAALNAGAFTHVVTTFDPFFPGDLRNSPEGRWTESDPNARIVIADGPVRVFELRGALDVDGCGGQRPLREAQLHGVPNLTQRPSRG